MDDIIFSQAWSCGCSDGCTVGWHQRDFWAYSDGTYSVDEYGDGDHQGCDEADLPTPQEVDASWREYAQHVVATGEDPLGNYYVRSTITRKERWTFRLRQCVGCIRLTAASRAGRQIAIWELPPHVVDYLGLDRDNRVKGFKTLEELAEARASNGAPRHGGNGHDVIRDVLTVKAARNPVTVARELRAAARRDLARS